MSATISLPSASAKLESAQGPALTSGAALCAAVTPATPDAVEAAIATTERKAAEEQAKAEAEAKAKAEAAAKAKAAQLTALKTSGKTLGSGVINAADVRLRSESSTSSSILATLSKGHRCHGAGPERWLVRRVLQRHHRLCGTAVCDDGRFLACGRYRRGHRHCR